MLDERYDIELMRDAAKGNKVAMDIVAGKRAEDEVEIVLGQLPADEITLLWNSGAAVYLEVKDDAQTRTTGNVFIEYEKRVTASSGESRVVPSGIARTEANVWVLKLGASFGVYVYTEHLKELARGAVRAGRTAWGGDEKRCHGALVPVDAFLSVDSDRHELRAA